MLACGELIKEEVVLLAEAHVGPELCERLPQRHSPIFVGDVDADITAVLRIQGDEPSDQIHERSLSRAIGPKQAHDITGFDAQVEAFNHL